ncbi:MAG: hypothetical protein AAFX99_06680 [Myxococcota bacterium]
MNQAIPHTLGTLLDDMLRKEQADGEEEDFDVLRERLQALGSTAMPGLLEAAQQEDYRPLQPVLLHVLLDALYPPAMPLLVDRMVTHEDPFVRFDIAQGLDRLAGYPFDVAEMVDDGWIQHDEVDRAADKLKHWWQEEGRLEMPTLEQWQAAQQAEPTERRSPREEVFGFVFQQPGWVVLEDGRVLQPRGPLPRHAGVYVVAGTALLNSDSEPSRVVLELDSSGQDTTIWAWKHHGWHNVTPGATCLKPAISLGSGDLSTLNTPFRLGDHGQPTPEVVPAPPGLNAVLATVRDLLTQPKPTIDTVSQLAHWAARVPDPTVLDYIQNTIATWPKRLQRSYTRQRQRLLSAQRAHSALATLRHDIAWLLTEGADQHPADNIWLADALGPVYERANGAMGAYDINRAVQVQVPPWAPRSVWIVGDHGLEAGNREDTVILEWRHGDWLGGSFSTTTAPIPTTFASKRTGGSRRAAMRSPPYWWMLSLALTPVLTASPKSFRQGASQP